MIDFLKRVLIVVAALVALYGYEAIMTFQTATAVVSASAPKE